MSTILHVEDDAVIAHVCKSALLCAGFQVEVAEDGLVASKMLFKSRPDLVVLDLLMPKLTGADVIKYIRSPPAMKSLPVLVGCILTLFLPPTISDCLALRGTNGERGSLANKRSP